MEVSIPLHSLSEWRAWRAENPWATDPAYVESIVEWGRRYGVVSPFLGPVAAGQVEAGDPNFRETFRAAGLNARLRAVLDAFALLPEAAGTYTTRIYAPEAVTPFALHLRGRYARFFGSEYLEDPSLREKMFPIPHEDLTRLSFPDASFDVVLCNEVFEHVPDLPSSLAEIARVLRPGGILLGTFPFAYDRHETIRKAYVEAGEVRLIGEPEYHPNPVDPVGSLVYQIPAWDVVELARSSFSEAALCFDSSRARGICATELAGIFLFRAVR